jgi:hypothetical protein
LPCGRHFASTFAPVGAPRDPVAGPTGSLDSTKGLKAGSRVPKPDRAGLGPTARITTIPEFVDTLSRSTTEAAPGPTARAWRGGAIGTNCASVHIRFRSPAPQLAGGGTFHRAGRGSGPRASSSERSRRAAPSSEVSPSAALVPHRPRRDFCSGCCGAPLRLLGPLEVPRRPLDPAKVSLGAAAAAKVSCFSREQSGGAEVLRSPARWECLRKPRLTNRAKRRSRWMFPRARE